jgi:hypothetical protein
MAFARSSGGREIGSFVGIVEVGFSLRRAWLACAFALDLGALNTARQKGFTTKEELMIIGTLVWTCKMIEETQQRTV